MKAPVRPSNVDKIWGDRLSQGFPAGMAAAKRAGVHCGRRPSLNAEHVAYARARLADGEPARHVARFFKVSEATLYRALARRPGP